MTNQLTSIDFHGQTLLATIQDNVVYTALKPICENIGLSWNAQFERIKRDEVLAEGIRMIRTPTKGGFQDVVCLPLTLLNGWLFGVDTNRVKAEIRETLITYKKECYQALFDYWNNGVAVNHRLSSDDTLPLRNAVSMATGVLRLDYATIYKMIHQRFGVDEIKDLTKEQVGQAVEYVHSLMVQANQSAPQVDNQVLYQVLCDNALRLQDYMRLLKALNGLPIACDKTGKNFYRGVVDSYNAIVKLAHETQLTNRQGLPMFTPKAINFYNGGALVFG